jgi:hypothetical protein
VTGRLVCQLFRLGMRIRTRDSIRHGMDALARRRAVPLFG